MPDNIRIKNLVKESGYTKQHIASYIGISRQSLSMKLNGKCRWSADDIKGLKDIFRLSSDEAFDIFFGTK